MGRFWYAGGLWLKAGALGTLYSITVTAPTSDGELITDQVMLEVLP